MRCAIIKQTTLKNIGPRVINPYRPPNLTFSYLLRIVSQMRNCKNPSSQVCVLKLKMEIIIKKKENIKYKFIFLCSFVVCFTPSHCNGILQRYVFIVCELILDPSAYSSSEYADKSSGVEIEREVWCASMMLAFHSTTIHWIFYSLSSKVSMK